MTRSAVPELTRLEAVLIAALVGRERYGLEIIETIKDATDGRQSLSIGGLYTTLHRMEEKGLVESRWGDTLEVRRGARRRYYKASGLGVRALNETRAALKGVFRLAPGTSRFGWQGAQV